MRTLTATEARMSKTETAFLGFFLACVLGIFLPILLALWG